MGPRSFAFGALLLSALLSPPALAAAPSGGTPTLFSASEYGMPGLATMALDGGVDPNAVNGAGVTPLILATREGHLEVVKLLLDRGAEPNRYGAYGYTPLMWAVAANKMPVAKYLLTRGANPLAKAPDGRSALDLAKQLKRGPYVALLQAALPPEPPPGAAPPTPKPDPGYWVWSDKNPPESYRKLKAEGRP